MKEEPAGVTDRQQASTCRVLDEIFTHPPVKFRGIPFWSWNGAMDGETVSRQIRDMHAHGMGGFFMHSREGLETEYLGPAWMAAVREAVKTAKELGMGAWLYDEDRWPSGAAGGLVTAGSGEFASRTLVLVTAGTPEEFLETVRSEPVAFACRALLEGDTAVELSPVTLPVPQPGTDAGDTPPPLRPGETYLLFIRRTASAIPWYNDAPPPDNMNPETVKRFLEITHAAYADEVGREFGRTIPGIFTDEPNVSHGHFDLGEKSWIPWTDGLPAFFRERRGYDIMETVPRLFFEGEGSARSRHDFWRTVGELFLESYTTQIHDWCAAHNLPFTGHFLAEGDLGMAVVRGGFVMPHYAHMDIPGIDILGSATDELLTVKQCASVANQFGKQVMTETYGGAGWDMTVEDQRRVGDWQAVLGATMRCPHLSLYSLKGARKRDFPPSFMAHNPSWKYNPAVEDYFSRLCALLAEGRAEREILVLHPLATAWSMIGALRGRGYEGIGIVEANAFGEELATFCGHLLGQHLDFDLGDETILGEHGRIEAGKLHVGNARYGVVVIPPGTRSLSERVLPLLEEFTASGGHLVAFTPLPDRIDGIAAAKNGERARIEKLFSARNAVIPETLETLFPALRNLLPGLLRITDEAGAEERTLYCMTRILSGCRIVFLVNTDRETGKDIRLTVPGSFAAEEWDPLTGERKPLVVERLSDGPTTIRLHPGPADSILLVLADSPSETGITITGTLSAEPHRNYRYERNLRPIRRLSSQRPANIPSSIRGSLPFSPGPGFEFERTDPNILVLDECSWKTADTTFSRRMPVWKAQDELRIRYGMRSIARSSGEQRFAWAGKTQKNPVHAEFRFEFIMERIPKTPVRLLAEHRDAIDIELNGLTRRQESDGTYLDEAFFTFPLDGFTGGLNILTVKLQYDEETEFENCCLLGDFGVTRDGRIIGEPGYLFQGDWCLQGYPHYAGGMVYRFAYVPSDPQGRIFLTLEQFSAAAVDVRVNGKHAGHILWKSRPVVELTGLLSPVRNELELELTGSLRNMLGPLRKKGPAPAVTGWPSFITEGESYAAHPVLVPYGLFGEVTIEELP